MNCYFGTFEPSSSILYVISNDSCQVRTREQQGHGYMTLVVVVGSTPRVPNAPTINVMRDNQTCPLPMMNGACIAPQRFSDALYTREKVNR